MKNAKCAVLLDGWACSGTRNIWVITLYFSRQERIIETKPGQSIIVVSPIARIDGENSIAPSDYETERFNAETLSVFLKDALNLYG